MAVQPAAGVASCPLRRRANAVPEPLESVLSPGNGVQDTPNEPAGGCLAFVEPYLLTPSTRRQWLVFAITYSALCGLLIWFFVWAFPRIVDSAYDPAVARIQGALPDWAIGIIIFLAVGLLPLTIFLPTDPFIWLCATIFPVGQAFAIAYTGHAVSMALPFGIARLWFRHVLLKWLLRYRWTAAILLGIRKAGPFRTTLLLRLGPAPSPLVNYFLAVPDGVPFWKYMSGSLIGSVPAVLLAVIFGRNIKGLAALLQGEHVPTSQLVVNLVSLGAAIVLLVGGYIYARRALQQLDDQAHQSGQDVECAGSLESVIVAVKTLERRASEPVCAVLSDGHLVTVRPYGSSDGHSSPALPLYRQRRPPPISLDGVEPDLADD